MYGYEISSESMSLYFLYLLPDGMYRHWTLLASRISDSTVPIDRKYSFKQKSDRKDLECPFGIEQSRFLVSAGKEGDGSLMKPYGF